MTREPGFRWKPTRRAALTGLAASAASACVPIDATPRSSLSAQFRLIEAAAGGTLGVAIIKQATGETLSYRGDLLFPHCSSFKLSLAALVLHMNEAGQLDASERVNWSESDLLPVSPFTTARLADGASLVELAEAVQKFSDNAAANVLLERIGGPATVTAFWRSLSDDISRLDRIELDLNNVPDGEQRDTTSPRAMARTVGRILDGNVLNEANTAQIKQWMVATQTGIRRVRAGLPDEWTAGDKTGTSFWPGMRSTYVDIGFVEPQPANLITFAAYYRASGTHTRLDPASEAVLAQVGGVLTDFASLGSPIG
ncbi:MAG: class A beta-lactamase [Sphingomonadales bacterium]|nr:MAG: class A beta-lactamase [Sphingomonadales bacterium]